MVVDIILELKKANPSLVYGELATLLFLCFLRMLLFSVQAETFHKRHRSHVLIYTNEVQRVASRFNLQERHKLEFAEKTSAASPSDGVVMASNGPMNSQHIHSCNNWIVCHFIRGSFCVITTKVQSLI